MFESSAKSMTTPAAPYPGIRNPIVVYLMSRIQRVSPVLSYGVCFFNMATALLSPFFLDLARLFINLAMCV